MAKAMELTQSGVISRNRAATKRIKSKAQYYQKKCMDSQEKLNDDENTCEHCSKLEVQMLNLNSKI